ncbi:hypothetical protein IJG14_02825, partial [bacterium]|nr:hypothetical protein [bacterium]
MNKVAVVVPVYLEKPSKDEKKSLLQTKMVLSGYPIIVVCPENINVSEYTFLTDKFIRFKKTDFKNVRAYSRLCLSYKFYEKFKDFEYIFICQPDGWVFKDELE